MTDTEARQLIAQAAAAACPEGWAGYHVPPDAPPALPAVVVVSRSPYRRPGTFNFCNEILSLGVSMLVARASGAPGVDLVHSLTPGVLAAVLAAPLGVTWEGTDDGPMIAPGGVEAYGSTLNVDVYI